MVILINQKFYITCDIAGVTCSTGNRIVHKKNGGTFGQQKLRGARRRKNS